jgi:D-alanine-D-alanine ligase
MKKPLKVLLLFDVGNAVPRGHDFSVEFEDPDWDAEAEVYKVLANDPQYEVRLLGIFNDVTPLLEEINEARPDIVFNLVEVFNNRSHLDKNIVSLLEMLGLPYTGASAQSLLICNNKALSKKILSYHKVKVPRFYVFERDRPLKVPKRLHLPLIVKPLTEEASRGISQASVVDNEPALLERVRFIHQNIGTDAIAEEYIDGRELYVSILGNRRVQVLPLREMYFGGFPQDEPRIATYKAKWDYEYREKWGLRNVFAGRLQNGLEKTIADTCKRAYRALNMKCYARFDVRVTPQGSVSIIEANANPSLNPYDEVAQSAEKAGISFPDLIRKIIQLAFERTD